MEVVLNKISLYLLALRPIRKRYTYKARRALKKAKTVLFVCKGNICRSPFAQYYTNILCSNSSIKAMSCGYYPENGRACPPQAIDAAKKIGVDLTSHRSSVVSEDIIRQAEVIFTFDEENRKVLIRRYPFIRHRIYWLGLLAEQGPITIRDPYGGDITDFESVYQNIIGVLNCATNSVDSMLWASADDKCECEL